MKNTIQLITNDDGRLSTTATVQISTFVVLAVALPLCIFFDKEHVPTVIYAITAMGIGSPATKGAVGVYRKKSGT